MVSRHSNTDMKGENLVKLSPKQPEESPELVKLVDSKETMTSQINVHDVALSPPSSVMK